MRVGALVTLVAIFTAGCGPNCQSTCAHVFDPAECSIARPGIDPSEQVNNCASSCEYALTQPGEIGSYDPDTPNFASGVELENERQSAAWMDCVWATAPEGSLSGSNECRALDEGYCAPTNF
jgi:hypothetical protein